MNSKWLLIFVLLLLPDSSFANKRLIDTFLSRVSQNAFDVKIINSEESSQKLSSEFDLSQFDLTGYLSGASTVSDDPPVSAFSASKTKAREYGFGLSKLWDFGWRSSIDYSLVDNFIGYSSRDDLDYFKPDLSLTFETSLFRDFFSGRLNRVDKRLNTSKEGIGFEAKVKRKSVLARALLSWVTILEINNEIILQKSLCTQIEKQTEKLSQKKKRGTISTRDYLLSRKELNTCRASVSTLSKNLSEGKESIQVNFNLSIDEFMGIHIESLFDEARKIFKQSDARYTSVEIEKTDDMKALGSKLKSAEIRQKELDSLTNPDLNLEVKAGYAGLNSELDESNKQIFDKDYPHIYVGLTMNFPWKTREAEINAATNNYTRQILKVRMDQLSMKKTSRFYILRSSLDRDFSIYKDLLENVSLSEKILKEARRDFNNGRIDFFTLSEFQKGLTLSRQKLAGQRTNIVAQIVEYMDYYNFFDSYF